MKAALYIRVSTEDQTEYSPAAQKNALLDYAQKNGYIVLEENIYIDEGISGRKADVRPAFMKMIKDAKRNRPFDVILVHRFDRFARNREDSVIYKSILKKECDIKVVSITEQLEDDKFAVILEAMLEAMAEYYSLNLSDEVLKGMYECAKRGGYQARAPFGYKMSNKVLIIDEAKKDVIKYIFKAYLNGEKPSGIADYLNKMGITTSTGLAFKKRSVQYILSNPTYAGYISFNSKKGNNILVQGIHENLIDKKTFALVKEKLSKDIKIKSRASKHNKHFLSGLIYCSACNSPLTYNDADCPFFQCTLYKKNMCSSHYIPAVSIEKAVLEALTILFSYADMPSFIETPDTSLYENQIKNTNEALERARIAYLNQLDTFEQYESSKTELTKRLEFLYKQLNFKKHIKPIHINDILQSADKETLHIIAQSVIEKIIYDKNTHSAQITLISIH